MPLILPGNVGSATAATGYDVDNSLRFNDGSSDALIRTLADPGGAGNRNKWTFSTWLKRSTLGANQWIFGSYQSSNYSTALLFKSDDTLQFFDYYNGSFNGQRRTNRVFRDISAWYHIVAIWDKDNGTSDHKMRIYVNGTEETSFSASSAPSNATTLNADGQDISIGQKEGVGDFFDGYMCETVFNDGQAYTADNYGEFDSDSPNIWKPIDVSGLNFGTTGFHLDYEDSSALGNDVSGNNNDFTVNNLTSVDQSTDTCTNNSPTWNSLDNYYAESTFQEGNLEVRGKSPGVIYSYETYNIATIGVSSGKWFWEVKLTNIDVGACQIGIVDNIPTSSGNQMGARAYGYAYGNGGSVKNNGSTLSGSYSSYTTGDIIGIALNLDDNELTFYKNGAVQNSGTAISITAPASTTSGFYFPAGGDENAGNNTLQANFGSPPFSISSGNSDGNNYGNFEYSVPSGYYALNTKNLAEFG